MKTSFAQVSDGMKITLPQRRIMRASTLKRKLVAKRQSPTNIAERMMLNGMGGGGGGGARTRMRVMAKRGYNTESRPLLIASLLCRLCKMRVSLLVQTHDLPGMY